MPGDILRLIAVVACIGIGLWYYYGNTPSTFAAKEASGRTMGTDFVVRVSDFPQDNDALSWPKIAENIQARLDKLDNAMSTFKPDSDISRFNASKSTDWFAVSPDTARVVEQALKISKLTDGAFDITAAPVVNLWGFGPTKENLTFEELERKSAELKNWIGYDKLAVRLNPPAIKKSVPELTLDLSAIAKGFAVDCLAELMDEWKLSHFMIEVGGEVRCRGYRGGHKGTRDAPEPWRIGIEKPLIVPPGDFPGFQQILALGDAPSGRNAMATSGGYRNFREVNGVRFSHIVDPRSALPTEIIRPTQKVVANAVLPSDPVALVSVLDQSCVRADALTTALFVLGEEKGLRLAAEQGLAVLFVLRTDQQSAPLRESPSANWPKL